jgi:hypothetical protein
MVDVVKFNKFIEVYDMPEEEKIKRGLTTQRAQLKHIGITATTQNLYKERLEKAREEAKASDYDAFEARLKELAFSPKSTSRDRELYARIRGWLVEKREDTVKFEPSASDYATITENIIGRLRENWENNGGVCVICGRPKTLLAEPCVDTDENKASEDG